MSMRRLLLSQSSMLVGALLSLGIFWGACQNEKKETDKAGLSRADMIELFYRPDAELLAIKYEIDTETVLNLLLEEDPPLDAERLINWEDRIGRDIGKRVETYSQKYGIPKQIIASMLIEYRAIRCD